MVVEVMEESVDGTVLEVGQVGYSYGDVFAGRVDDAVRCADRDRTSVAGGGPNESCPDPRPGRAGAGG